MNDVMCSTVASTLDELELHYKQEGELFTFTIGDDVADFPIRIVADEEKELLVVIGYFPVKVSKANLDKMYKVVNEGSIKDLFVNSPVNVAGKTGTAQISANEPNHALFVSYAPYENPEISVSVVIPNAYTSSNAASLASMIYQYYFDKSSRKKLLKHQAATPGSTSGSVTD